MHDETGMLMCEAQCLHAIEPESALNAKSHTHTKQESIYHLPRDMTIILG
ncbi:hypothetical protein [Methanospirillum sp.]|nr:hypothetical protein [Methanospirillum sp.]HOL42593.1 hypothetical protein [Methanospirillum sp.]